MHRPRAYVCRATSLFITKQGKRYDKEKFKTLWHAARTKLGLAPREITFHDMRAKAAADSDV